MDDTTQQALDGTLDVSTLTEHQRARLAEAERLLAAVVASIPSEPMVDLGPEVLRAIAAARHVEAPGEPHRSTWWQRLWRPRPVTLHWRPAYAIGMAAVLVVALVTIPRPSATPTGPAILTRFELSAPDAHKVSLAGGFTNWQPEIELTQGAGGTWTVVVPLEPGIHTYAFVIDGERWVPDPGSPTYDDGFGGQNSRLTLLPPDGVHL